MRKAGDHYVDGYHERNELPHLKRRGATYFVTTRLAGTLPAQIIADLKAERARLIEDSQRERRPLSWHEQRRMLEWYSERVDSLLDSGIGHCWLAKREIAELVIASLCHFDRERYELHSWVIMPNHVHLLITPIGDVSLSRILQSWKTFTALRANRLLKRVGETFWQRESYDHVIRDNDELRRIRNYIECNPVKAGLCDLAEQWRWSSVYEGVGQTPG
jgi:REP element-mobilizing transposase RayT